MKRNISKRIELNEKEARLLRLKAKQTGLSEGEYLRELIMNSQPVEAPPRQFYMNMQKVNQLVADVSKLTDQIASFTEGPEPLIEEMRGIHQKLLDLMIEVKKTVSSARYYASSAYEAWMHQVEEANKKGEIPPEMED